MSAAPHNMTGARELISTAQALDEVASLKIYIAALRRENGRHRHDKADLRASLTAANAEIQALRNRGQAHG
jgi:hypothetical protein